MATATDSNDSMTMRMAFDFDFRKPEPLPDALPPDSQVRELISPSEWKSFVEQAAEIAHRKKKFNFWVWTVQVVVFLVCACVFVLHVMALLNDYSADPWPVAVWGFLTGALPHLVSTVSICIDNFVFDMGTLCEQTSKKLNSVKIKFQVNCTTVQTVNSNGSLAQTYGPATYKIEIQYNDDDVETQA